MNFAESFQNFIAKFTGLTDRLENTSNALDGLAKNLGAKDQEILQLKADKVELQSRIDSAPKAEDITRLENERDGALGQVNAFKAAFPEDGHFTFGSDAGKPVIALTNAGKTALINDGVTRTLAASGHAPLRLGGAVDTASGATAVTDDKSPDAIRERAVAATNAQVTGFLTAHNTQK